MGFAHVDEALEHRELYVPHGFHLSVYRVAVTRLLFQVDQFHILFNLSLAMYFRIANAFLLILDNRLTRFFIVAKVLLFSEL